MKTLFAKIYYGILLMGDGKANMADKFEVYLKMTLSFSLVATFLQIVSDWYVTNQKFIVYFIIAVTANAILGLWKHHKLREFDWLIFFWKTALMLAVVIIVYLLLYILVDLAGNGIVVDGFKTTIQIATIFYPISKAIKSLHVISNGEHPPAWIMEKLYGFEKDGNVDQLFKTNTNETLHHHPDDPAAE